jgi:hypothetical protein
MGADRERSSGLSNPDLASIEASLLLLVRQAYDQGRRDALKKVADVLREEPSVAEPLALMAPAVEPKPAPRPSKPWWSKR